MITSGRKLEKYKNYKTSDYHSTDIFEFYKKLNSNLPKVDKKDFFGLLKEMNEQLIEEIIKNGRVHIKGLRYIYIAEKKRKFKFNDKGDIIGNVDWEATKKLNKLDDEGKMLKVYFTDSPFYYNIIWQSKTCRIPFSTYFNFKPSMYFKRLLAKSIKLNNLLTLNYKNMDPSKYK
jgi:hypothetical protein